MLIKRIGKRIIGEKRIADYRHWKTSRRLRLYGDDALHRVAAVCNDLGVEYWMMFGSLLGAYREHGFIKHDDDLDLGILSKNINQLFIRTLIDKGFVLTTIKETSDNNNRMVSFKFHGITVDFYGFALDENRILTGFSSVPLEGMTYGESRKLNKYRVYLVHYPDEGLMMTPFNRYTVPIPQNTTYILEGLYGKSFMEPIKGEKAYGATIAEILPIEQMHASLLDLESL